MFNLLFILTTVIGLGIFGYMIALIILVLAIKSLINNHEFSIVKTWVINIKLHYKKALKLSLFFTFFGVLFTYNTLFFYLAINEGAHFINVVLFYVMLILDLLLVFGLVNSAFIFVYFPSLEMKKIIINSFLLIQVIPLQAIFLLSMIGLLVFLLYIAPLPLIFIGFSLTIYLFGISINYTYLRLVDRNSKSLDIRDI